jgi:hypothetical protein
MLGILAPEDRADMFGKRQLHEFGEMERKVKDLTRISCPQIVG